MGLLDYLAILLASDALLIAWFYGSIFENKRTKLENSNSFIAKLLSCNLCLSYYPPFLILLFTSIVIAIIPGLLSIIRIPIYGLAMTDIIHFLQQIRPFEAEEEDTSNERDK